MKIDKQTFRPANKWGLLCPLMLPQLVICFASFQSCHSHNQFFHNSPPSQQHLAAWCPAWARLFVFQRLCSTWQLQFPCTCTGRGWMSEDWHFFWWLQIFFFQIRVKLVFACVCTQYMCAALWVALSLGENGLNLPLYLHLWKSRKYLNIFNMFPLCQPPCYLHNLNLLLIDFHYHTVLLQLDITAT